MAEEESGWKKDLLIVGLIAPIVGALVSPLVKKLLEGFDVSVSWLTWVSDRVVAIGTYRVPVWLIGSALAVGWGLYRGWGWLIKTTEPAADDVMDKFKTAVIQGIRWSWDWNRLHKAPTELQEICPECGMNLRLEDWSENPRPKRNDSGRPILNPGKPDGSKVECEKCGFTKTWDKRPDDLKQFVNKEIVRLANTGEWMERV